MSVLRLVVFPALRLLVWAVIALSLVWLAFFRGEPPPDASTAAPSAEVVAPEVPVARGNVENLVELTGSVSADPALPVKTTAAGKVTKLRVRIGDVVEVGTPLLEVVTETPVPEIPAAVPADPALPVIPAVQPKPKRTTTVIKATSVGTLATLDVLVDQEVAVGDAVASVSPGTLTVAAPLTQEQQFRLLAPPTVADVTVPSGPAPFVCTDVRTTLPGPGAPAAASTPTDPYSSPDPSAAPTGAVATCRVPPGATVFVGMSATMALQAGSAPDVLVLPVTAVEGSVSDGTVYVPATDGGEPQQRSVELGLTDGEQVEIRSGLQEGDSVLEFVPTSDEPVDGGGEFGGPFG